MYTLTIILLGILPPALLLWMGKMLARNGDLHPFTVLGWTLVIGYSIKSLYLAYAVNTGAPFRTDWLSLDIVHVGQLAVCLGLLGFMAGYMLLQGSWSGLPFARATRDYPRNPEYYYYPILWVSILLMLIYFYQMGFVDQILNLRFQASKWYIDEEGNRNALGYLTIGGDLILVYFLYWLAFTKRINLVNLYVPAIGLISLSYMLASRRNGVLLIIVTVIMVYGIRKARERLGSTVQRNAIIAVALVLLTFVSAIRVGGGEKSLSDLSLVDSIRTSAEQTFEGAYFLDPAKTAAIIRQTDRHQSFLYGSSFAGVVFAPVPRILWPEKPDVRIGPYVAQEILDFENRSGVPPGAIGEFYMNFGWAGVFFGMMMLGLFTAWIYNRYRAAGDKRFARPSYALLYLAVILFLFADFSLFVLYLIRYGIGIFICVRFWQKMVALEAERTEARLIRARKSAQRMQALPTG